MILSACPSAVLRLLADSPSNRFPFDKLDEVVDWRVVPLGLRLLAESEDNAPGSYYFSSAELDEIVAGKNTEEHLVHVGDTSYLSGLLPRLNWWIGISSDLSVGRSVAGVFGDPMFERQRDALLPLLQEVLSCYPAAVAAAQRFSGLDGGIACLELLKRYRIFTRAVCDFAREVWPDVNLEWIIAQA